MRVSFTAALSRGRVTAPARLPPALPLVRTSARSRSRACASARTLPRCLAGPPLQAAAARKRGGECNRTRGCSDAPARPRYRGAARPPTIARACARGRAVTRPRGRADLLTRGSVDFRNGGRSDAWVPCRPAAFRAPVHSRVRARARLRSSAPAHPPAHEHVRTTATRAPARSRDSAPARPRARMLFLFVSRSIHLNLFRGLLRL